MSISDRPEDESDPERARSWRYGELTQEAVVEAGLRLTRRSGFGNLSMRKLAAELGSSSMNSYYYVRDKRQLFDLVADAVLGEVPIPPPELPWDRCLTLLFEGGRDVLLRYPGVAQHLLRRSTGLPNETQLYMTISRILDGAGFDRVVSDRAQRSMAYLLFGAVTTELASAEAVDDPTTMKFSDDREVFRFGLELLIDGLHPYRQDAHRQGEDDIAMPSTTIRHRVSDSGEA
jgi:TetR/AcrR family transcriptional regulator, tetracycline repressor protein